MDYRREIDGLRALAVLPVILFHAGFEMFSGGFVGVDVFFVISGYLITAMILAELEQEKFSIVNFYERRARRILPALFFIMFLTLCFSLLFLPPHAIKDIGQSIFAVSLFVSNIFFYKEIDYFANTSELAPLLHTWSLGVEEQFYIVFPFLLLLLRPLSSIKVSLFVLLFLASSLVASEWLVHVNSQLSFFMPFTRFWELAVGSLIAINEKKFEAIHSSFLGNTLSLIGIFFIAFPIFLYDTSTTFPGFTATVPVIGAAFVIAFGRHSTFVGRFLSFNVFVGIGLISYSLYLSHNVVFAIIRNIGISLSSLPIQFILMWVSVLIALISYFLIEKPLRFVKLKRGIYLFLSILFVSFFAMTGYALHKTDGLKAWKLDNLSPDLRALVIDSAEELRNRRFVTSQFLPSAGDLFDKQRTTHNVLILGDSKSEDLYISIIKNYSGSKYQFRRVYVDDPEMTGDPFDTSASKQMRMLIASQLFEQADEVVLAATWQSSTNLNVVKFIEFLIKSEKKVSLVSTSNFNDVASLSYVIATSGMAVAEIEVFLFEQIRQDWQRQYQQLLALIKDKSLEVRLLEKLNAFCNFDLRQCSLRDNQGWYMYDSGHLTVNGYDHFGGYVLKHWFVE